MISKGKPPTAAEKQWRKDVVQWVVDSGFNNHHFGHIVNYPNICQLHHCVGARAKVKVNLVSVSVGELFLLYLPLPLHDIQMSENANHPLNITNNKKAFIREFGTESYLFEQMVEGMKQDGYTIPFDDDVLHGILRR